MARKSKVTINVNEKEFTVKGTIMKGKDAPLEHRVAARVKIKKLIDKLSTDLAQLKVVYEEVNNSIETVPYEENVASLIDRGKLSMGEEPVFELTTKDGGVYSVSMSGGTDDCFEIDPSLSQKSVMDGLDERYKKVSVTLDKKVIKEEFESGTLPPTLRMFCQKNPVEVTKLRVKVVTEPTVSEEEKED